MNSKQIVLQPRKPHRSDEFMDNHPHWARSIYWTKCLPFIVNPRGSLIHRVKRAESRRRKNGERSHDSFEYWCGNIGKNECQLFCDPPEGRLLCKFCEAKAVAFGEKSADELAGRHVHVGTMKPIRSCCKENKN